jgi:hypothetical protein
MLISWPPHSGPLRLPSGFRHPSEHWNPQGGWSETRHTETRPWAATKVCFLVSNTGRGHSAYKQFLYSSRAPLNDWGGWFYARPLRGGNVRKQTLLSIPHPQPAKHLAH